MTSDTGSLIRDPKTVDNWLRVLRPWVKTWHRSEVRGMHNIPDEASLIVSNHSGGAFAMDWPVFAVDFADRFGVERPLNLLSHSIIFQGQVGRMLRRVGLVPTSPAIAREALEREATLMVFPGGDYDVGRPTSKRHVIDFAGRTGYVTTAVAAGVPIVPMVSIGGQENQLYLVRGERLARMTGFRRLTRASAMPLSFGLPFGLSFMMLPLNAPLPTKIVTQVLEPIDVGARFGPDPDPAMVDAHVRGVMQLALDDLARERRFPVLG